MMANWPIESIFKWRSNCSLAEEKIAPTVTVVRNLERSVNHNSTAGMEVDEASLDNRGAVLAIASLNDDAAWYRNDNPDHFTPIYEVTWNLPVMSCDCLAHCRVMTDQRATFTDAADDAGGCKTFIAIKGTQPDGNFASMIIPTTEQLVLSATDSADAEDQRFFNLAFVVNAGVQGKVALANGVFLYAQDGRVETILIIRIGESPLGVGPANLQVTMIPR